MNICFRKSFRVSLFGCDLPYFGTEAPKLCANFRAVCYSLLTLQRFNCRCEVKSRRWGFIGCVRLCSLAAFVFSRAPFGIIRHKEGNHGSYNLHTTYCSGLEPPHYSTNLGAVCAHHSCPLVRRDGCHVSNMAHLCSLSRLNPLWVFPWVGRKRVPPSSMSEWL